MHGAAGAGGDVDCAEEDAGGEGAGNGGGDGVREGGGVGGGDGGRGVDGAEGGGVWAEGVEGGRVGVGGYDCGAGGVVGGDYHAERCEGLRGHGLVRRTNWLGLGWKPRFFLRLVEIFLQSLVERNRLGKHNLDLYILY